MRDPNNDVPKIVVLMVLMAAALTAPVWVPRTGSNPAPIAVEASPRLVGFGCEGLDAPAMGSEESDFPECDAIVPVADLEVVQAG